MVIKINILELTGSQYFLVNIQFLTKNIKIRWHYSNLRVFADVCNNKSIQHRNSSIIHDLDCKKIKKKTTPLLSIIMGVDFLRKKYNFGKTKNMFGVKISILTIFWIL